MNKASGLTPFLRDAETSERCQQRSGLGASQALLASVIVAALMFEGEAAKGRALCYKYSDNVDTVSGPVFAVEGKTGEE